MKALDMIHMVLRKVLATCSIILFAALVCTVTWQVFARKVLISPSGITEELAKIIFVWLVLISAAYLFGERDGHMNVAIIPQKLKGRAKTVFQLLSDICVFGFSAFVLSYGGNLAVKATMSQVNSAMTFVKTGQIYMALPICGVATLIFSAIFIVKDILKLINVEYKEAD